MAANHDANFDVGPLTWVKTEIDHSLTEARLHLDKVAADPADGKALKYVATHLHQVTGALSMVSLGAATRFNEEIERIVAAMEQDSGNTAALAATAKKGISALSGYLDSLIAGHPDRPMMLASVYVELNRARGASDAAESDLFHPDLAASLAPPENTVVQPSKEMLAQSLKRKRAAFQAGLLKLLKEKDFATGLRIMLDAVLGLEALQLHAPSRMFWFTASGFFDAVAHNPRELGSIAVTLFAKVDQQIRLLQDGVQKVPERLFRDLLLVIGKSGAQTTRVRQIRELYRLDDLLARPGATRGENADEGLKSVVRNLRELTQTQKENWLRFAAGNRAAIEAFATQGDLLVAAAANQPNTDLAAVFKALSNVGATLRASGVPPSEAAALEIATVLLFIENSLENYFTLSSEFASQAKTVASRVASTLAGVSLPPLDPAAAGLMDDITKRAQERLLLFQVGQEVQVNLQSIEQVLDAYFRDPFKTSSQLPGLAALFAQVGGALTILELDEAAVLNQLLSQRVSQFASGARKGEGDDADAVAEGISALGLYVSALQQGQSNPREVLLPALIRFNLAAKPVEQQPVAEMVSDADIEAQKQKAQSLFEEWKQKPEQTHTRDQLKQVVSELKRDAELVSDSAVAKQSGDALSLLEQAEDPGKTGLHEAFDVIAPAQPAVPPVPPSAQVVQLLDKEGAEIDAEILQIFLEEAREVVATINENLDIVRGQPHDREAMTTIRRGFHTLKGSGRMVGLIDLGEVAWQAEQVMNKWLKEEKPPSHGLLRFIELASDSFSAWVTKLQESGNAQVDGSEITRIAEALKNGKEPDFGAAAPAAIEEVSPQFELPALDLAAVEVAQSTERIAEPAMPAVEIAPEPVAVAGLPVAPDEEEVQIGEVVISKALFSIFLGEADQHIATLNEEMRAIEVNPLNPVSHEFMRAAHTLNSSSLTTRFVQIADVAYVLEKWLQDAIELPPQFDAHRLDVTRRAVDALTMMVGDLAEQNAPLPRDDIVLELKELRDSLAEARRTGEGTHVRMRQMSAPGADVPAEALEPSALEGVQTFSGGDTRFPERSDSRNARRETCIDTGCRTRYRVRTPTRSGVRAGCSHCRKCGCSCGGSLSATCQVAAAK